MKKGCELCTSPARMYCDSDGASLCWECDARVHSANFLVAKHSRCLLCHLCQSLTPWLASGTDLGRTVSICVTCAANKRHKKQQHESAAQSQRWDMVSRTIAERDRSHEDTDKEEDDDDDEVSDSEGEYSIDDDEEGENQVVPWSCTPSPGTSFSNSEDLSSCTLYTDTDTDTDCCSSAILHREDAATPEVTSSPPAAASEPQEASISLIRSYYRPWKVIRQESVMTFTEAGEEEIMARTRKRFKQSTYANDDKVSNGGGYVWDMQH